MQKPSSIQFSVLIKELPVNRFAYYLSGYALKAFSGISRARITIHDREKIPKGSLIFTANHFTRIETVFLPYHIHEITKQPVWSLAAAELFQGSLKGILEAMGAVSTRDPQRDFLIVKSLLGGKAECVIFPEGMMVKNKKTTRDGEFMLYEDGQIKRPHTGAAILALTTEFYRERLRRMRLINPDEFDRLVGLYELDDPETVLSQETFIVPVNLTYYPVRAKENMLSKIAFNMLENPSERVMDELLTEGTMLFSGVDVDIRFGDPISIHPYLFDGFVESDLTTRRPIHFSSRLASHHVMRHSARKIMEEYMQSVYTMTTLNHDHIFASILKYMPQGRDEAIDPFDFRCRAYLATFACAMSVCCNFHRNLYENQIHLLTNDRFNKFDEFLKLAVETGVVEVKGGMIYKNPERLDAASVFHTVRMENPVSVIANEVEPLTRFQALLADIAVKSPTEVTQLLIYRIEDQQFTRYLEDFKTYGVPLSLLGKSVDTLETSPSTGAKSLTERHRIFCRLHDTIQRRKAVFDNGRPRLLEPDTKEKLGTPAVERVEVSGMERVEAPTMERVEVPAMERVETPTMERVEAPAMERVEVPAMARHLEDRFIEERDAGNRMFCNGNLDDAPSSQWPSGIPFGTMHRQEGIGVLLIHDYLSSPGEMVAPARFFQSHGLTVYLPRLPGHGTVPDNLSQVTYAQWLEAVEEGTMLLGSLCSKVVVGGLGIGGILGLALQSVVKGIDALFMIAPPTRIKDYPADFLPSTTLWDQVFRRAKRQPEESEAQITCFWDNGINEIPVPEAETSSPPEAIGAENSGEEPQKWTFPEMAQMRYSKYPVSALKQVELLLGQVASDIKANVSTSAPLPPLLMIQSRNNPFVDPEASRKLFDRIQAPIKEYYLFDDHRHGILSGKGRQRILEAILGFVRTVISC